MEDVSAAVLQRRTSGRACLAAVTAAGAVLVPASHVNAAAWSWLASAYGVPPPAQPASLPAAVHAPSFLRTSWMTIFGDPASDATLLETAAGVALASGELHLAKQCVAVLQAVLRMPKSSRLARLRGMLAEAEGKHAEALKIYNDALTATPMNVAVWKRKVAALKATTGEVAAAAELAKLCEAFPGDAEAWTEMAEMQLAAGKAAQAAFCYEELILLAPNHPDLHVRLAECLAATGDVDALRSARLHACEGAKLTGYTNAYALTTLADVCWLHARAVAASSRRSATSGATEERATYTAERVTLKSWLNRADAVARDASSAAAAWPAAVTATPQSAAWVAAGLGEDSTHVKEDADLLAFAAKKLAALRASPSSSQASAFERVEMACLHASNIARVAACAAALKA